MDPATIVKKLNRAGKPAQLCGDKPGVISQVQKLHVGGGGGKGQQPKDVGGKGQPKGGAGGRRALIGTSCMVKVPNANQTVFENTLVQHHAALPPGSMGKTSYVTLLVNIAYRILFWSWNFKE
ncbi:unnamed protein product [Urochloa humidicola]